MAVQIPNLPAVAAAAGTDLYETVQSGVSSKVTLSQITTYVQSQMGTGVTGLSFGTTGLLPNTVTGGTITVTGTLIPANGGTGIASYAIGDLVYASGATTLSRLADAATGNALLAGGVGVAPAYGKVDLTTTVTGTLPVANGGSGVATRTIHSIQVGNGTSAVTQLAVGATGQVLTGATGADPAWTAATSVSVTSISFGTTGLTPSVATQGAIVVSGTLVAANGGTGIASYAIGDILYADTTTTLARLADVATGSFLVSGGVGVAPAWAAATGVAVTSISFGTTGLTPNSATKGAITVAGTLIVANGGTGLATLTAHALQVGNGTGTVTQLAVGTTGQILTGSTGADPAWAAATGVAVTSISFGTMGLTPNSATQGAIVVSGTLVVSNGGTGAATLTGIIKGNGTSAMTAATAGSDYVAPGTATTFTAKQTFNGTTAIMAAKFTNVLEVITVSATAATGTINYDITTQSVLYYTTNASANWTVNFRASSGTSLDSAMATGEAITVVFMVTQGGTPFYNNGWQIDGNAVTPKWQGGSAPAAGNASSVDVYSYTIVKTGSAAFTVFASQTQFK